MGWLDRLAPTNEITVSITLMCDPYTTPTDVMHALFDLGVVRDAKKNNNVYVITHVTDGKS